MPTDSAQGCKRFFAGLLVGPLLTAALCAYSYKAHFYAPTRYDETVYFGLPFHIYYTGWVGTGVWWPGVVANPLVAVSAGALVVIWLDKRARAKTFYP